MRARPLSLGLIALSLLFTSAASAQQKKKPKPPPAEPAEKPEPKPDPKGDPTNASSPDPPPIDANLKEADPSTPATNPWVTSGLAKRKDGSVSSAPPSNESASERKRRHDAEAAAGARPISVAVQGGYASSFLGVGFGARAGYTIADAFYIGGQFMYHIGPLEAVGALSIFYPSVELGYDYKTEDVTVRGYGGAGLVVSSAGVASQSFFGFYPGLQVDYSIPSTPVFVGIDGRLLVVLGDGAATLSVGVFAIVGARF